ncbi:rhodanese-like domain-containing protein [Brachyspira innocens]|uniref:Rhodanese-like domain-containing protein n=1 Tax=Brachyspira innocens TaxID=13264 RepID=A0ABT8YWL0_9SPIR|nr:rhodanese-like domain-containing protein [Brachyspira innocens]MDO6992401.1 rhodanese-like domain-containing protein [Brachyspira innocens]MDO7020244.1 rhodanese-like domain-containing protein [Brachyspira innocens]
MLKSINVEEAVNLIKSNDDIQLIDVRSQMEIDMSGTIEGSILVDLNDPKSEKLVNSLDKEKKYLLYCASGSRSILLGIYMDKSGFLKVYNLKDAGYGQLAIALKDMGK